MCQLLVTIHLLYTRNTLRLTARPVRDIPRFEWNYGLCRRIKKCHLKSILYDYRYAFRIFQHYVHCVLRFRLNIQNKYLLCLNLLGLGTIIHFFQNGVSEFLFKHHKKSRKLKIFLFSNLQNWSNLSSFYLANCILITFWTKATDFFY